MLTVCGLRVHSIFPGARLWTFLLRILGQSSLDVRQAFATSHVLTLRLETYTTKNTVMSEALLHDRANLS